MFKFYMHYQLLGIRRIGLTNVTGVSYSFMLMFYNIFANINFVVALITLMQVFFMVSLDMHYELLGSSRIVFTIVAVVHHFSMH